jgi:hypothetical protein
MVFLLKKETKLDKKIFESINTFEKDINFLLKKINTSPNLSLQERNKRKN